MKNRAAAKERRLLILAAVFMLSALLLAPTSEASRSLPAALAPALAPPTPAVQVLEEKPVTVQAPGYCRDGVTSPLRGLCLVGISEWLLLAEARGSGVQISASRPTPLQTPLIAASASVPAFARP